jgi:hypothetical protein
MKVTATGTMVPLCIIGSFMFSPFVSVFFYKLTFPGLAFVCGAATACAVATGHC